MRDCLKYFVCWILMAETHWISRIVSCGGCLGICQPEFTQDDFWDDFWKSLLDLLFRLSMTSMWNTDDTQGLACTLISTPVGSLHPGLCLSLIMFLGRMRKRLAKSILKQFLLRKVPTTPEVSSLSLETQASNYPKKILRPLAPAKYPSCMQHIHPLLPPPSTHQKSTISGDSWTIISVSRFSFSQRAWNEQQCIESSLILRVSS